MNNFLYNYLESREIDTFSYENIYFHIGIGTMKPNEKPTYISTYEAPTGTFKFRELDPTKVGFGVRYNLFSLKSHIGEGKHASGNRNDIAGVKGELYFGIVFGENSELMVNMLKEGDAKKAKTIKNPVTTTVAPYNQNLIRLYSRMQIKRFKEKDDKNYGLAYECRIIHNGYVYAAFWKNKDTLSTGVWAAKDYRYNDSAQDMYLMYLRPVSARQGFLEKNCVGEAIFSPSCRALCEEENLSGGQCKYNGKEWCSKDEPQAITNECIDIFSGDQNDGSFINARRSQCQKKYEEEGIDPFKFAGKYPNCACFLDNIDGGDFYTKIGKSIEAKYPNMQVNNTKYNSCIFSQCSKLDAKYRDPLVDCGRISICLNDISFNNEGVINNVSIKQDNQCKKIFEDMSDPDKKPSPDEKPPPDDGNTSGNSGLNPFPELDKDKKEKAKTFLKKNWKWLVAVGVILLMIAISVVAVFFILPKIKSS